jgi:hypothetical protein
LHETVRRVELLSRCRAAVRVKLIIFHYKLVNKTYVPFFRHKYVIVLYFIKSQFFSISQ